MSAKQRMLSIPEQLIVYDSIVALDPALAYDVFARFSIPPGAVVCPLSAVLTGAVPELPDPISSTYRVLVRVAAERLRLNPAVYFVECWSNRSLGTGPQVEYHVDNDEDLRRKTGSLSVPAWGGIYHAGPDAPEVGGTWFDPPLEDPLSDRRLFTSPLFSEVVSAEGRLVEFRPGRFILFDGRCPHCVAPFARLASPRVTILVNFWPNERRPRARGD